MKISELIKRVKEDKTPDFAQIGREFFAGGYGAAETREFLLVLLEPQFMEGLCDVICAAYFNNKLLSLDYTNFTGLSTLDSRYFNIFIAHTALAKLGLKDIFPYLLYIFSSPEGSRTAKWKESAQSFIFKEAGKDFDKMLSYFSEFDTKFSGFGILLKIDYSATVAFLIDKYIKGDFLQRTAIKKFFLDYKPDVVKFLIKKYEKAEIKERRAIVQLLLIYKNEGIAGEFLNSVLEGDENPVIKKIISKNFSGEIKTRKKAAAKEESRFNLQEAMINGKSLDLKEFNEKVLSDKKNRKIAETIFFTVLNENNEQTDLCIIHKGVICGLDNEEYKIPENYKIGVLHPCEIQFKHEFIKRLLIDQQFEQLKRKIYRPQGGEEKGYSNRLFGRVLTFKELMKNAKKYGFRFINKENKDDFRFAAIFKEGYAFVIEFTKIDPSDVTSIASSGNVRFYRVGDLVKMNGRFYTKNVPPYPAFDIPARVYSELMYFSTKLLSR